MMRHRYKRERAMIKRWEYEGRKAEMTVTDENCGYASHVTPQNAIIHAHGTGPVNRLMRERFGIRPV